MRLNNIQRDLVCSSIAGLVDEMVDLYRKGYIKEEINILPSLLRVNDMILDCEEAQNHVWTLITSTLYLEKKSPGLVHLIPNVSKIYQFCKGRLGEFKLEKLGGPLTQEQREEVNGIIHTIITDAIKEVETIEKSRERKQVDLPKTRSRVRYRETNPNNMHDDSHCHKRPRRSVKLG